MLEFKEGNLWDYYDRGYTVVIPTNLGWKSDGSNVMGAGVAKQAAERFPDLPALYGAACRIKQGSWSIDHYAGRRLIMFPTKPCNPMHPYLSWQNQSSMALILKSIKQLKTLIDRQSADFRLAMPYPGCGNGGKTIEQVKPLIERYLVDCNVVVLEYKES